MWQFVPQSNSYQEKTVRVELLPYSWKINTDTFFTRTAILFTDIEIKEYTEKLHCASLYLLWFSVVS